MKKIKNEHVKSETGADRIRFYKPKGNPISIDYKPNWTLGYAMNNAGESVKKFSLEDHILFAELDSPSDCPTEFAILPDILCSHLKPGGKIRSKAKKGATPCQKNKNNEMDDEEDKGEKIPKKQLLFYVNSTNLRGSVATRIKNTFYDGKPLCVIAYDGDKLKDAVLKDGRFSDELTLYENDDTMTEVSHQYLASDHVGEVFNAIFKKKSGKRKKDDEPAPDCETPDAPQRKKSVYSTLPSRLTDDFTEKIGKAMIEDARNSALETFGKSGKDTDKRIQDMIRKFGKMDSAAIPARVLVKLAQASKSVGFIRCGGATGTCFLLAKQLIITCQHVINKIHTKRSQSTDPELYRTIFVHFEYNYPNDFGARVEEIDETKKSLFGRGNLDYAIMVLKSTPNANLTPLYSSVRSVVPSSGPVVLIGHPQSEHKRVEICTILPAHNWHATLFKRASAAEQHCNQNPDECGHSTDNQMEDVQCVHIHAGRPVEGEHSNQLPYDTSFFEGASGSPVFNPDGHIVAMHTQGYPFMRDSKKCSLMEFGVTFSAIYRDIKERYGDRLARHLFPNCEGINGQPVSQGLASTTPPNTR